jgi:hypothetical protein
VEGDSEKSWYSRLTRYPRPVIKSTTSAPPATTSTVPRVAMVAFLIAVVVPGLRYQAGTRNVPLDGADAGALGRAELVENGFVLEWRADSPTSVCTRWSHQSNFLSCQ